MGEKDVTREPYRDGPRSGAAGARKLDADARRSQGSTLIGYLAPDGSVIAITGDEEAPFFKTAIDAPALLVASDLPQQGQLVPSSGVLIVLQGAGELHEAWAIDHRDPATPGFVVRWLQLFDDTAAPLAGAIPNVATVPITALPLCHLASYDFVQVPLFFTKGIVLAISTTPNRYTAIPVASNDYAITARVLPTKE